MSTLEERLREELGRSVAGVRPAPDPLGRLLRRRRRRRVWRWGGPALGAVIAAALLGGQVLVAPAGPEPYPSPHRPFYDGQPLDEPLTEWTRRILDAPVRGNAAAEPGLVDAIADGLRAAAGNWRARPELDRVQVLFVADVGGERVFGAVFHDDRRALYVGSSAPMGTPVAELVDGHSGEMGALSPFSVHLQEGPATVALAPPGCSAEWAATTHVRPDGTLARTWAGGGDFVTNGPANRLWRVTCDGVLRETVYSSSPVTPPKHANSPPPAPRGYADPDMVKEVLWSWPAIPDLEARGRRILWGGTPPGELRPVVVALGDLGDGAVQVCAVTGTGDALLVDFVHGEPPPANLRGYPTARLTTAVAPSDAMVAVRLPADDRVELSERLLVLAPPEATELRIDGGQDQHVALSGGVGVIIAPVPASLSIEALDTSGRTVATLSVAEPHTGHIFAGEGLMRDWP
ncbi:hypothetical protein [Dactylosporangium sp. CA-092794]|uniref:hypothetical protein n=1 Tax=Dactylosporangium sp. CA-092794 TaxID=3239929 RepID=UPI003D8A353A